MKDKQRNCYAHRKFKTHGQAYAWARVAGQRLASRFRVWSCRTGGQHWHIGHARGSIWAAFEAIEAERRAS